MVFLPQNPLSFWCLSRSRFRSRFRFRFRFRCQFPYVSLSLYVSAYRNSMRMPFLRSGRLGTAIKIAFFLAQLDMLC